LYWDALKKIDDNIGAIMRRLKEIGCLEDTLIVVTADHGIRFRATGEVYYQENNIYDTLIRVPLVFYNENAVRPGHSSSMVRSIDILPTILSLLAFGQDIPPVDGKSLTEIIAGNGSSVSEAFIESRPRRAWARGIRTQRWKYVLDSAGAEQLFLLEKDPGESLDVGSKYTEMMEELRSKTSDHFGVDTKD
jgi:choline-sulfatase